MTTAKNRELSRRSILTGAAALAASPLLGRPAVAAATAQEADADPGPGLPGKTPHTRFAVNVEMWWRELPFLERLDQTAALGFPAVEFWGLNGKDVDAIADRCQGHGLEIAQFTAWGFRPGLNHPKNHDRFVDAVGAACEVAKKFKARCITVVGGYDQPGMTQEEMHQNIAEGLRRAAPIAEKADVVLILEPMNIRVDHKGHCLYGSAPTIKIIEAVASGHVKINWDLYHMQITEGDLCGHLREGMPHIGYVQLADNPGRNEPGTGEIHYNRVLQEVANLGYTGLVGLECNPKGDERVAAERVAAADVW